MAKPTDNVIEIRLNRAHVTQVSLENGFSLDQFDVEAIAPLITELQRLGDQRNFTIDEISLSRYEEFARFPSGVGFSWRWANAAHQ